MVLQIDPAELLRETLEGCDIETDIDTIDRIAENLRVLQTERENKIVTGQQELQSEFITNRMLCFSSSLTHDSSTLREACTTEAGGTRDGGIKS